MKAKATCNICMEKIDLTDCSSANTVITVKTDNSEDLKELRFRLCKTHTAELRRWIFERAFAVAREKDGQVIPNR